MFNPVEWFVSLPPEWTTFFISMFPVTELRASIPIGIEVYGLAVWKVWILAVLGDTIPAIVILYFTPYVHKWVVKKKFLGGILTKKLESAEKAFAGKHNKYGAIALIIFVGIPLPMTGSWTGSLVAFIFNIPFKKSLSLITAGVCMAATLVTLITLFAGETLRLLF
ncbi:MAG: hypothetical protein COX81_01565 [Candidatus Magasanikbacteria bacterium CG_4_10_14_0_2_um_filter_37_12]|uniref:Ligand-binding protein SH3 n=1 Tax=Candidatus Magasanikbacteria bacterium CG_4_10_14_0_2_um_filter_37_12 TaxID=1974637 RepID=A0A2M7V8L3_9BACT|nr:MAG: hypothetical protein COX81_01565 [Candidatus Magasanikbacteria bacterium CG_4_10_14_0_2_um_filter_37_12]